MRSKAFVLVALAALSAPPALAQPKPLLPTPVEKKPSKATFPMPADQFQERMDAKIAKAREKLERVTAKMSDAQARAVRKKFESFLTAVNAQIAKAVADGVVTKAEADRVNDAFSSGH
jgi:hypothetical protein